MRIFIIDGENSIVCDTLNTRNGFKHEATLLNNGLETDKTKVCYQNRTWESYEYQTVLLKLLRKHYNDDETKKIEEALHKRRTIETEGGFRTVANIAKMGEILCTDQKDKNDWKKRMLTAGLPGLELPEDWNTLSEDEKAARLDNVIAYAKGGE